MKKFVTVALVITSLCWWGMVYPQYTILPDFVIVLDENGKVVSKDIQSEDFEEWYEIWNAKEGDIILQSRLLEWIEECATKR